jgi:uncharacterized protein
MKTKTFNLTILQDRLGICRLNPSGPVPAWVTAAPFFSVTRSSGELSVVCSERSIPERTPALRRWRALRVKGVLGFSEIGVIASLADPLRLSEIPIFVLSTHDTDYILVRDRHLEKAVLALTGAGHRVSAASPDPPPGLPGRDKTG